MNVSLIEKIEKLQKEIAEQSEFIEALVGERLYIKAELASTERSKMRTELHKLLDENARSIANNKEPIEESVT